MRKIDRAYLKRVLGGVFPNGPRGSSTLLNEAEGRVYLLGWQSLYQDFTHPLRTAAHFPADQSEAHKSLTEWHDSIERIRRGELEGALVLQVPQDPAAAELQVERVLDGVFFGEIIETDGELWFRADERLTLNNARAPRQDSA